MKIFSQGTAILICAFVVITVTVPVMAQPKKHFTRKDLPLEVRSSFEKMYPHAVIKGVGKEVEEGKTMYEIESMDSTTRRDILFMNDGTVYEVEETVPAASLPKEIMVSLNKAYPKSSIQKAEKTTRGLKTEFEVILHKGKKSYEVVVSTDGRIVEQKQIKAKKEKEKDEEGEEEND